MEEKKKAATVPRDDLQKKTNKESIYAFDAAVKRNDLNAALDAFGITPKEAVINLRKRFPAFDRSTLSKCGRPNKYGCVLHPVGFAYLRGQAIETMCSALDPNEVNELVSASLRTSKAVGRKPDHRYNRRVAGRLPDEKFERLKHFIELDGYETTQDWVTAMVDRYLADMEARHGT